MRCLHYRRFAFVLLAQLSIIGLAVSAQSAQATFCIDGCKKGGSATISKVAEGAGDLDFHFELLGAWITPGPDGTGFNPFFREFSLSDQESITFDFAPIGVMVGMVSEVDIPSGWSLQEWETDPEIIVQTDPKALGFSFAWGGDITFSEAAPDFGLLDDELRLGILDFLEDKVVPDNGVIFACKGGADCAFNLTATNVPLPAAAWLFLSGLLGLAGIARKNRRQL